MQCLVIDDHQVLEMALEIERHLKRLTPSLVDEASGYQICERVIPVVLNLWRRCSGAKKKHLC